MIERIILIFSSATIEGIHLTGLFDMKIVILGGTGLIGSSLKEEFLSNHEVECFGREAFYSTNKLLSHLKGSDLVIQLSGSTIAKRWTKKHLKEVWESRVDTNNMLQRLLSY